jgi:hypothetical protein
MLKPAFGKAFSTQQFYISINAKHTMAKLKIDFVLLDESVVMNGFRALMLGAELDQFKANPVMLFMHNRATEGVFEKNTKEVILPIGKWYDIRVEGNRLLAKPEFDDNDDFALQIQSKVEGGYLNAASIWIDPIAASDEEALMLPGQRLPTITKWGVLESSIVDIPNCRGALALRNSAGEKVFTLNASSPDENLLSLLHSINTNKNNMEILKTLATKLGLSDSASEADVLNKLTAVLAQAQSAETLKTENEQLKTAKEAVDNKLTALEAEQTKAKNEKLIDDAVAAGKLAAGEKDKWMKLAAADYATTEELINGLQPYKPVANQLNAVNANTDVDAKRLAELMKLSGRELYMQGLFPELEKLSAEVYAQKHEEYFKTKPKA